MLRPVISSYSTTEAASEISQRQEENGDVQWQHLIHSNGPIIILEYELICLLEFHLEYCFS